MRSNVGRRHRQRQRRRQNITATPGSHAVLTRSSTDGDAVAVRLPMRIIVRPGNDNPEVAAVTHGPVVLSGDYGDAALSSPPSLDTSTLRRTSASVPTFTAAADGAGVDLAPFYDAHGHNCTVYWKTRIVPTVHLVNAGSSLVLGIQDMSTAGNATVLQWTDNGTADHRWTLLDQNDGAYKIRNEHSGELLAIVGDSTAVGAFAVQDSDNGTADNRWRLVPNP